MIAVINYSLKEAETISKLLNLLNEDHRITNNELIISKADKIILTGSENLITSVRQLHLLNLFNLLRVVKKPVLGISEGMHLLCNYSEEKKISCLGMFDISIGELKSEDAIIQNRGYRKVTYTKESKLFDGIIDNSEFYFEHSSFIPINEYTTAVCNSPTPFSAAIEKKHFYGVQFYPEKSGEAGLKLLKNFIDLCSS